MKSEPSLQEKWMKSIGWNRNKCMIKKWRTEKKECSYKE